jgi:hypothetical protein
MRRLLVLLCTILLAGACSEPPAKEMDRAQGALDAAAAAGAEQYAPETFRAARTSLEQSHAAVAERDYRLALSLAIDANDRAQAAAKEAADGKARARGEAEREAAGVDAALKELQGRLAAAQAARVPARELQAARAAVREAEAALQEVRAMIVAGDVQQAIEALKGRTEAIREQIRLMDRADAARQTRRRR